MAPASIRMAASTRCRRHRNSCVVRRAGASRVCRGGRSWFERREEPAVAPDEFAIIQRLPHGRPLIALPRDRRRQSRSSKACSSPTTLVAIKAPSRAPLMASTTRYSWPWLALRASPMPAPARIPANARQPMRRATALVRAGLCTRSVGCGEDMTCHSLPQRKLQGHVPDRPNVEPETRKRDPA